MANEGQARFSFQIQVKSADSTLTLLDYRPPTDAFNFNVSGTNGPTPGALTVTRAGVDVSFAQLTAYGGMCSIKNMDPIYKLTWGVKDGTGKFHPIGDILPGEAYPLRLSVFFGSEFGATGTGTFIEASGDK